MKLRSELGDNFEHVPIVLNRYKQNQTEVMDHLTLKGKSLNQANMEHATHLATYDQYRIELKAIKDLIQQDIDRTRGALWKHLHEKIDISTTAKDKEQYINADPAIAQKQQVLIEVTEMYDRYSTIVEAFKARGFALNNIVKLRIGSIEHEII